jgi:hypothetical protein
MSLGERFQQGDAISLDQELAALQHAVTLARRNRWHGGDVLEPEFETFLAALTRPRDDAGRFGTDPTRQTRRNSWRETIDATR